MKAAVRCESLNIAGLARAEKHGKREDWIGKQRQIRDVKPLVAGGMDLVDLYEKHVEGARQNKAAKKPVLHFIVKFPPEVLTDDGPTPYASLNRAGREKLMVKQAVRFINENHGGQAVFAARLDRDEAGETIVDVFACPKYMKESRSAHREPTLWTSATRFGEELARKHQEHIRTRLKSDSARAITSPRAVGMAIQQEFAAFFERENRVKLDPRKLKESRAKDRIEVEEWRLRAMEREAMEARQERDSALIERDKARQEVETAQAAQVAANDRTAAITAAGLAVVDEMTAETIRYDATGKIRMGNPAGIKPGLPELAPLVRAAAVIQQERDKKRSFMSAQIVMLEEALRAVKSVMPIVRHYLTKKPAIEKEVKAAKAARKEVIQISKPLRGTMNRARAEAAELTKRSTRPENPAPETPDLGGLGL